MNVGMVFELMGATIRLLEPAFGTETSTSLHWALIWLRGVYIAEMLVQMIFTREGSIVLIFRAVMARVSLGIGLLMDEKVAFESIAPGELLVAACKFARDRPM